MRQQSPFLAVWLLPLIVVLVFVHPDFEPSASLGRVSLDPPDVAAAVAIVVAAIEMRRTGRRPGSLGLVWILLGLFLLYALVECFLPLISNSSYDWKKHIVTWGKFTEFALLAPASAVLLARRRALRALAKTIVALAVAAAVVGLVQFAGAGIFRGWGVANREPSFTGVHELGALGVVTLSVVFVANLNEWLLTQRWIWTAALGGIVCAVLSGTVAAGIGLAAGAAVGALVAIRRGWLSRRSLALLLVSVAVCGGGIFALRAGDISQYTRYIGLAKADHGTNANVQTYAQRSLQFYIGYRVWRDHPVFGAGWISIREPSVYGPQLPAAHREFPDQPPLAFPSPQHPWGIDNAYAQVLAELGLVGAVLFGALLIAVLERGLRASLRRPSDRAWIALLGTTWALIAAGLWIGQDLNVSPVTDTLWLGIGLIAVAGAKLDV
jgi:O-antigen ligase